MFIASGYAVAMFFLARTLWGGGENVGGVVEVIFTVVFALTAFGCAGSSLVAFIAFLQVIDGDNCGSQMIEAMAFFLGYLAVASILTGIVHLVF